MRILAISHEYPPVGGGGANACLFLLDIFARRGHSVSLVTTAFAGLPKEEVTADGVCIYRVDSKRERAEHCGFGEMLNFLLKSRRFAAGLAKKERFDIVLVFFGIPSGPVGVCLKRKFNLPFIIRFGGGDIPGFQDRFSVVYKFLAPAIKAIWKRADSRIANSSGLRELAYGFCEDYPFEVIPNGVDTSFYAPVEGAYPGGAKARGIFRILFVSRLLERKGLQHVIPQLPGLREALAAHGIDVRLTLVGDGPYRSALEDIAKQSGVYDICEFAGQKDKAGIVPFYQDADVFILPSAKEGMPNVVLEAMACGLPVIMTPCQGSRELLGDGGEGSPGYVCGTGEFGKNLLALALDDGLRLSMVQKSLETVRRKFTWESTADAYLEIMDEIVEKKRRHT